MSADIHPTAIVEPGAELGADVSIGAYAFVGARARLGDRTVVHHHASIDGLIALGPECEVFPFACLGLKTQDLKFKGGLPGTRAGARNVFREFTTVHSATRDGELTVIGDDNHLLAYTHVAHDCHLGSHIVMSNYAGLAGHVVVGDHVVVGAYCGVHQFCRIGPRAMIGGLSKVVQDVPPFLIADGNPAVIRGFNKVGLERAEFSAEQIERVKSAFRLLYRSGLNRSQALEQLRARPDADSAEIAAFVEFAQSTERGLCPPPAEWANGGA